MAVPTLVLATAGPLRSITPGCCLISTGSFRDSRSSGVDSSRRSIAAPHRILSHGGMEDLETCQRLLLKTYELPRVHAGIAKKVLVTSQRERGAKLRALL